MISTVKDQKNLQCLGFNKAPATGLKEDSWFIQNIEMTFHLKVLMPIHCCDITKTCLYNADPLKPHFYVVKLGFTGVYTIFLISAQKRGTPLELPC